MKSAVLTKDCLAPSLSEALSSMASIPVHERLSELIRSGLADLPQPGGGQTLDRWRALCNVARSDLPLAKLYEAHTDAVAILAELGGEWYLPGAVWATWATETPGRRLTIESDGHGGMLLSGSKAWCSGALGASHALLTAWAPGHSRPQLVAVELAHPSVTLGTDAWRTAGTADTASADVAFHSTPATLVGRPGDYLGRPGFWHGSAGMAACWYGGLLATADILRTSMQTASPTQPSYAPRAAALSKVDVAVASTGALLREAAAWIDTHPRADATVMALRLRQATECAVRRVLEETGHAIGAAPFSRNGSFARMAADLPLFMRQGQGDRDETALASALLANTSASHAWAL